MPDLRELWWLSVKDTLLIDREGFMRSIKDRELTPILHHGELAWILIQRHNEIHILKTGKHPMLRSLLRATMRPGLDKYGSLITRIAPEDAKGRAFVRRIGFTFMGQDGPNYLYLLKRPHHV